MHSDAGDTTQLVPGFPIRTPWDHSLVDSSPRPIAASHVLHRLLVPRHPPSALGNLTTKMLASTVQFSNNGQPQPHNPTTHPQQAVWQERSDWTRTNHTRNRLFLQDPTGCSPPTSAAPHPLFPTPTGAVLQDSGPLPAPAHQCLRQSSTPPTPRPMRAPTPHYRARCSLARR